MAELLSKQYASVFSKPKPVSLNDVNTVPDAKLSDIKFTRKDMEDVIDELRGNAATGIDGFPAILLKKCKTQLSLPIRSHPRALLLCTFISFKILGGNIKRLF